MDITQEVSNLRDNITEHLETKRPYWNQCVMFALLRIAEITDKETSNKAIRELGLKDHGWNEVNE